MKRNAQGVLESLKNQYQGPNAHLLSLQQTSRPNVSLWKSFHNMYIAFLTSELNQRLPKGYIAANEQSLQIETLPADYPDSAVFDRLQRPSEPGHTAAALLHAPTWEVLVESFEPADMTTVIRTLKPNAELGDAVARVEVLSPSNKDRRGLGLYLQNRLDTLRAGTILYEIDLLHETPSHLYDPAHPDSSIPLYPHDEGAKPYLIAVTDPRLKPVSTQVEGFNVDDPFPLINILLLNNDLVPHFNLGIPYNQTFEGLRCGDLINYTDYPDPKRENEMGRAAMSAYSPADQKRIEERMLMVAAVQDSGESLENGPFPIDEGLINRFINKNVPTSNRPDPGLER